MQKGVPIEGTHESADNLFGPRVKVGGRCSQHDEPHNQQTKQPRSEKNLQHVKDWIVAVWRWNKSKRFAQRLSSRVEQILSNLHLMVSLWSSSATVETRQTHADLLPKLWVAQQDARLFNQKQTGVNQE